MAGPNGSGATRRPDGSVPPPPSPPGGDKEAGPIPWWSRLVDPRTAVLTTLGAVLILGGGRKVLQAVAARRAIAALGSADPDPRDVRAAAEHGRAVLGELLRLLDEARRPEVRAAAGQGLARLWRLDELIAEEERTIVARGFAATWRARRTYPRALTEPITLRVDLGVGFLRDAPGEVGPGHLRWSYRVLGTQSARLEAWTDAPGGSRRIEIPLDPADYAGRGPHRLTLQVRVATVGLTDSWTLTLPDQGFALEFDFRLDLNALLTLPDASRGAELSHQVRLRPRTEADPLAPPLPLGAGFLLPDPPVLTVGAGLPCDLAHRLAIEVEGIPGVWPAGLVVVASANQGENEIAVPLGPLAGLPDASIDRPGPRRVRALLTADPGLGWADPDVRSVWPDSITTDWVEVRVLRA